VIFYGTLADAQIRSDILAGMPQKHHVHYLMLPLRQCSDPA
jgi:hypothetical protein